MGTGLKVVSVHLLHTGRIGEVEYSHTVVLGFALITRFLGMGVGKHSSLRSVKYLYLVYCHLAVLFEET